MISNNAGDQIAPAAQAARDTGITVVTWDSPIPSAEGEQFEAGRMGDYTITKDRHPQRRCRQG